MAIEKTMSPKDLEKLVGQEIGVSDWIEVDQGRINQFADVTEDHQFIHIDPEAAAKTPFGGAVAHGFLTLSLLSRMGEAAMPAIEGVKMGVNYGFEKVRFLNPVPSGKRIRGVFTLMSLKERAPGQLLMQNAVKVEIEGDEKPALMAEWLTAYFV